jgi:hypothetical protein
MNGAIPPLLQYVFMAWCLVKHRDNFTFLFSVIPKQCQMGKADVPYPGKLPAFINRLKEIFASRFNIFCTYFTWDPKDQFFSIPKLIIPFRHDLI